MQQFTGRQYLAMDIAGNFGLDNKLWSERLAWFEENKHQLHELLHQAEEPALYYAAIRAYESVERGEAIGYAISLDATSSGLQLLACLTGDRRAAEMCNVVPRRDGDIIVEHRADAYTEVYEHMLEIIGEDGKIERKKVKVAVMTSLYGSKKEPREIFGEGTPLLAAFYNVMETYAPAAWELNQFFIDIWDPEALSNDWVLPDNHHVHVKVMDTMIETVNFLNQPFDIGRKVNMPTEQGRSLGANTIHSLDALIVREIVRRCDYDQDWIDLVTRMICGEATFRFDTKKQREEAAKMTTILWDHFQQSGYLSARILDYLDSDTVQLVDKDEIIALILSMPAKPFKIMTIHDCFRCLPHYGDDLRRQYTLQLYLIAKSNLLSFLLSQLLGKPVNIGKLDPTLADDIMKSDYALS